VSGTPPAASDPKKRLKAAEGDAIRSALRINQGRVEETARDLGISRTTLWRKMKKLGIDARAYQAD
jgi:transcriptional activator for dhaKLM operon